MRTKIAMMVAMAVVLVALVGSVSDSVVRHAHCPVLVARGSHT